MNTKLRKALREVALTSQSANELVDKVVSKLTDTDVANLQKLVEQMQGQIMELQLQVASNDLEFTEDDATQLYDSFKARIRELAWPMILHSYTRNFFLPLSPPVRKVLAKVLLDESDKRDVPGIPLWVTIYANNGEQL